MTYDHTKQYRCAIVRGKSLSDLDNLLPAYANILEVICPCDKETFKVRFNEKISAFLSGATKKTLSNHRTEIAGKLFGMYYLDENEIVQTSERTLKLLDDSDQPAFFKDLCAKYQFPSGMNKADSIIEQISKGIKINQLSFLLKVLLDCHRKKRSLTKKEIGYYILNSEDVLSGRATSTEVITQISDDRTAKIEREVSADGKGYSYSHQHINEQLNLLYVANVITFDHSHVYLNKKEMAYIENIARKHDTPPFFDFYSYDLSLSEDRKRATFEWGEYFGLLSDLETEVLATSVDALQNIDLPESQTSQGVDTVALGNEGEEYVYQVERSRVEKVFPRLVNKIKKLGKVKGLGFDIQSVWGEGENAEFAKYIEVKSTKRVTTPSNDFCDTVNLTRNEWMAAQQHQDNYFIYRVYFSQNETKLFIIKNPYRQNEENYLLARPLSYRLDFNQSNGKFYAHE